MVKVEVGLVRVGAGTGGCFMMIGSAEGSNVPWSFSFMSFIAIENSNLSIFPSLFISARVLRDRGKQRVIKGFVQTAGRVISQSRSLRQTIYAVIHK